LCTGLFAQKIAECKETVETEELCPEEVWFLSPFTALFILTHSLLPSDSQATKIYLSPLPEVHQ
jgi:hypothetical protein